MKKENKIGIIGDIHLDISDELIDYQLEALKNTCKEIHSKGINTLILLGDIFNNRKKLGVLTLNKMEKTFQYINDNFQVFVVKGNHDFLNKHDDGYNSIDVIFSKYNNFLTVNDYDVYELIPGVSFIFKNWVFDKVDFVSKISEMKGRVLVGHFDINDFYLTKGMKCDFGIDKKYLSGFDNVITGHYHIGQDLKNIHYVGSLTQLSFNDLGDSKRYAIFDGKNLEYFKVSVDNLFAQYKISEIKNELFEYLFDGKKVKLIIDDVTEYAKVSNFISEKCNPVEIKVSDDVYNINDNKEDENFDIDTDMIDVSKKYIENNVEINDSNVAKKDIVNAFVDTYKSVLG